ncbi:MAG TPA: hypothetical protein PLP27_10170 [Crocinitomicaceae bacterium]|nr:hypothetical protein [Crocinitomicaceae bacterium]
MTATSPYEFYGPVLCVRGNFLFEEMMTRYTYDYHVNKGNLFVVRQGKGKNNYSLIEFESINIPGLKQQIETMYPLPNETYNPLKELIKPDNAAISYFATQYRKPDGSSLPLAKQQEYATTAILLNAIHQFIKANFKRKKSWIWQTVKESLERLEGYKHTIKLTNERVIERTYKRYMDKGYISIIHGGVGNANGATVTDEMNNLIMSLYVTKNNPFAVMVHRMYMQFLGGVLDIVNRETGELYNPDDFVAISEGTIYNIINNPKNRALADRYRMGSLAFNNTHRPHHHRHAPVFALSKVSMDDRDLPRKMTDGKRVKAYYAYDVASHAIIGASYSKDKDTKLFIDCMKDMLQFCKTNEVGIPMELEVEHHLVNNYKNDLMKAGTCFPFVRWCAAGNSQEKRAEHFNKEKKYGFEKRYQEGIGRWYAKNPAYRTVVEKIFDSENNNYKDKKYEYAQLVAEDREIINEYNNSLHPNQKKYKGMTRMQVLLNNVNPNCAKFDEVIWARYVGKHTTTTIKRNQYMRVQYADYTLPAVDMMDLLQTNNYEVDAYYLPNEQGEIESIFIYQNDQFICECPKIEKYNEATAEHTEADKKQIGIQARYVKSFDERIKKAKESISKLEVLQNSYPQIKAPKEELIHQPVLTEPEDEFEALLRNRDENFIRELAKERI